jgi:hypothetical protein
MNELRFFLVFAFLPASGNRNNGNGLLYNQGANGNYWSISIISTNAYNLNFNSGNVNPANSNNRANGFALRCIKNLHSECACSGRF